MNRVDLIGRLTRDPELRQSQSGNFVCKFTVAITRFNPNGEDGTDFIGCTAFSKQAENLKKYVFKGNLIGIEGSIQTGSYDDKDGKKVYTTDVIVSRFEFLESKNSSGNSNNNFNQNFSKPSNDVSPYDFNSSSAPTQSAQANQTMDIPTSDPYASFGKSIEINDDELPF